MKISEISNEKHTVSARVNKYIFDQYKESEIPISTVVESSMIYFLKLQDQDKMKFIAENLPDTVNKDDLKHLKETWSSTLMNLLKEMNVPESFAKSIVTGSAIAAVTVIGGAILSGLSLIKNDK